VVYREVDKVTYIVRLDGDTGEVVGEHVIDGGWSPSPSMDAKRKWSFGGSRSVRSSPSFRRPELQKTPKLQKAPSFRRPRASEDARASEPRRASEGAGLQK
jgi:hypothetical protein